MQAKAAIALGFIYHFLNVWMKPYRQRMAVKIAKRSGTKHFQESQITAFYSPMSGCTSSYFVDDSTLVLICY